MSVSQRLRRAAALLTGVEQAVLGALLAAMVILAALQILLRNCFATGLAWVDPFLGAAMLWLTMLGALAATGQRKHITVDLLSHLLPAQPRRIATALTDLFAATVCACLGIASARYVLIQRDMGGTAFLGIPGWIPQLIMPVGFALMVARFLAGAIAGSLGMRRGQRSTAAAGVAPAGGCS